MRRRTSRWASRRSRPTPRANGSVFGSFQIVISAWQKVLVEARDDKWDMVRATWPELPRCCVDGVDLITDDLDRAQATAAKHALENRLDLMNVRAQVVDAWRQLAVFANALLGVFTVQYQLTANLPARPGAAAEYRRQRQRPPTYPEHGTAPGAHRRSGTTTAPA